MRLDQKTFLSRALSSGLLRNDAVARGSQAHVVHLDESLAIKAQAVDQSLEVTREHVHLHEGENDLAQGPEVKINGINQRGLQAVDTSVLRLDNREAGLDQSLFQTLLGRCAHGTDQWLDAAHEFGMLWICGFVGGETDPVQQ